MFPSTPVEFLEEQAEELAGKPVALERFIGEHLSRNSEPPDYWRPRVIAIKTETAEKEPQNVENREEALDHNLNDQGLNNDNIEDVTDPQPGTSRDAYPKAGPSKQSETIDLTEKPIENPAANNETDETDATNKQTAVEEMTEEDMANKRLETLVTLFPQTDPEFLHEKAVEFGSDKDKMNRWIEESIENGTAKEFPSRADYEKRQNEANLLDKYSGKQIIHLTPCWP